MKQKHTQKDVAAPIIALDLGNKRVGVAVSDALSISVRRLKPIRRFNWKDFLREVSILTQRFDAQTLVIGLPLSLDGTPGTAATQIERTAKNFARSLKIPVFLQDERLTSLEAEANLKREGVAPKEILDLVDSESAAIILRDFLTGGQRRNLVSPLGSQENTDLQ